jgi:cytochrome c-type biogenesis protein CcmF
MATIGSFALFAALVASAYAAAASVAGARRGSYRLVASGLGAFFLVAALLTLASAVMIHAFVTDDYRIQYVNHYSDSLQPFVYKLTSYWGGLDGSILFWVFLLSVFGIVAVRVNRERHRDLIPYVVAVVSLVEMFFLFVMVLHRDPFATFLTEAPVDGRGLNPLLQNPYMVFHPPTLYVGFVGMTIPYAFAMAALVTGQLDDAWLRAVRRWTMVSWLFLSFGLVLGMIWAYEVLGWGGYWGWDPVENAGLLPWLTATAFIHSLMVQERRGMLRVWNVSLVVLSFFLTIFGTFMTRSGVVQSVHAFGEDRELMLLFTGFMLTSLSVSVGFIVYRLPLLRGRRDLDSWLSREAAVLVNNWLLAFAAFFVLFATMFPTISEAVTGEGLSVGPPFFDKWMGPIGLMLIFLTGIGPLLAWRKTTLANLKDQFLLPVTAAVVTGGALRMAGVPFWGAGLCFALCALALVTILQEFTRGVRVRRATTGLGWIAAAATLAALDIDVTLVETSERLGGNGLRILSPRLRESIEKLLAQVSASPRITVCLKSCVVWSSGHTGRFVSRIRNAGGNETILTHGTVILATGGRPAETDAFGLGTHDHIITQFALEQMLHTGELDASPPGAVAMIQCAGSREEPNNYCSRICCIKALTNAIAIKERFPKTDIRIFYRDIMTCGDDEKIYTQARRKGILFIPFEPDDKPKVTVSDDGIEISSHDPVLGAEITIRPDILVLSTGLLPNPAKDVSEIFGVDFTIDGFIREADFKWRPLDTKKEGIFVAGLARGPLNAEAAMNEGEGAAYRAFRILSRKALTPQRVTATVRHAICSRCELCVGTCPYGARFIDAEQHKIMVDIAACQGCGACAAICPNSATLLGDFEDHGIMNVLETALL